MKVLEAPFIQEFIRLCEDGWRLGWHEYHGGNLSYRIKKEELEPLKEELSDRSAPWKELGQAFAGLGGEYFLVTGSGECFRNTAVRPKENFGIAQLNEKGDAFRVLWGLEKNGRKPTSEFLPHLSIHKTKRDVCGEQYRLVYHSHPTNLIVLSAIMEHDSRKITKALWDMEPECPMTFPNGIGVVDWMVPGTAQLAEITGELMKKHDAVLWSQHGVLVAGSDFDTTLGITHTLEKAAEMFLKIRMLAPKREQCPTEEQYRELAEVFHLSLAPEYIEAKL